MKIFFLWIFSNILILDNIKKKKILTQGCKEFLYELINDFKMDNSGRKKKTTKNKNKKTTTKKNVSIAIL